MKFRCALYSSLVSLLLVPLSQAAAIEVGESIVEARKVVMLDAGSSGVRAMDYCFGFNTDSQLFELISQSKIEEEKQPLTAAQGLSDEIINTLSDMYRHENCSGLVMQSHFFLGGTAGLRSRKNTEKVGLRLHKTAQKLQAENIDAVYEKNVRLLSGLEEAAYTWLAVNYIKRRLVSSYEQYGVLELGGGSVQLAFRIPLDYGTDSQSSSGEFIRHREFVPESSTNVYRFINKSDGEIEIYGKSHLNFGLRSAIARYKEANLDSPCIYQEDADAVYQKCAMAMKGLFDTPGKSFANSGHSDSVQGLIPETIYLNGFFYDRTVALGLDDHMTVSDVRQAAQHICSLPPEVLDQKFSDGQEQLFNEFMKERELSLQKSGKRDFAYSGKPRPAVAKDICAELTYISVLLEQFGIDDSHTLIAIKALPFGENNHKYGISWPLGYAVAYANDWLPEFRRHRVETTALAIRTATYADLAMLQANSTRH